jgi:hypothetical protein
LDQEADLTQLIIDQYQEASSGRSISEDEDRISLLKRAYELGFEKEKNYKGCAQCTLAALFELTGKKEETLFQASSGLSGGVGLNGNLWKHRM